MLTSLRRDTTFGQNQLKTAISSQNQTSSRLRDLKRIEAIRQRRWKLEQDDHHTHYYASHQPDPHPRDVSPSSNHYRSYQGRERRQRDKKHKKAYQRTEIKYNEQNKENIRLYENTRTEPKPKIQQKKFKRKDYDFYSHSQI